MSTAPFILLVNPWITDFAAYDLWPKPLDLLIIGALLREPLTHNNSYFACRRPDFTYQDLLELKKEARLARRTKNVVLI